MATQHYIGGISGIRRDVLDILYDLKPDPYNLKGAFWSAFIHKLFTKIYEGFITKSEGGQDELGNKWEPLSLKTRAYRNSPNEPGVRGEAGRGLLSHRLLATWKAIYSSKLARLLKKGLSHKIASQQAAAAAWSILKAKYGAQTLLMVYADRKVRILRVTEQLMASLAPGILLGNSYLPPPNQIYIQSGTSIKFGTNIQYAEKLDVVRNVMPDHLSVWYAEAITAGLKNVQVVRRAAKAASLNQTPGI